MCLGLLEICKNLVEERCKALRKWETGLVALVRHDREKGIAWSGVMRKPKDSLSLAGRGKRREQVPRVS